MAKKVIKRRKAAKILKRKPRSLLGIVCVFFSLAAVALSSYETSPDGYLTHPAQIFEAFADHNLGGDEIVRMRASPLPPTGTQGAWRTILEIPDGDTLKLDNGETVRLIGVDTPESSNNRKLREDIYKMGVPVRETDLVQLGLAATDFTRRLCLGGRCWLEYENNPQDQYGRTLAYVHLPDGTVLNEEIISQGYGKVYLGYSFKYKKRYLMLQTAAGMEKRGLWQ